VQELSFLGAVDARLDRAERRRLAGVKLADASDARLPALLRRAARAGRAVAVHCIEPAETGAALQAAARVGAGVGRSLRIEHAAFVPPDWIGAVARVGATVVTHPSFIHAYGDRYLADPLLQPPDWLYRLASWRAAGVPLAFASDAPFGPPDPLGALRAAATRRTVGGATIGAAEALTDDDALQALTTTAARCAGLAHHGYGRLAAGGPGAAVVLSEDPRSARVREAAVVATVIGGRVVD
jgi:predicted amidohydrolase YtcJ